MKQPRMRMKVSDDRARATIEFLPASGVTGEMTLDREQMLALVQALGQVHAAMGAGLPSPALQGQQIEPVIEPRWFVQPELMGEASALAFHHPGFGPIGFLIPIAQIEEMIRLLTIQVEMSKASRAGPPS